ncbi:MAG TPA: putative porin, partial [Ignavibacteriaceae bacterium]
WGVTKWYKPYPASTVAFEPGEKLDFTLAGEIKKLAIFYFVWENLFGNQYYITPYYPMPDRNVRFGLAWELFN